MSSVAGLRLTPFTARSYAAFRISEVVPGQCDRVSPLGEIDAGTIDEALSKTLAGDRPSTTGIFHKDKLAIREADETGEVRVHLYVIRKKAAAWVQGPADFLPKRVADLYAEKVCVLAGEVWG